MENLFEELEMLIFHNEIEELAKKLIKYLNEQKLNENKNEIILLGNRHNRLSKDKQLGMVSHENFSVEQAQIVYGFLNIIEDLKKQYSEKKNTKTEESPNQTLSLSVAFKSNSRDFSELRKISFYSKLLNVSKNICRIEIGSNKGYGTGFIIKNGWLLTNNHVLSSPEIIDDAIAQFNYEEDDARILKPIHTYKLDKNHLIMNEELNYTFVKLVESNTAPKLNEFIDLKIVSTRMINGQNVIVIQHPMAKPKEIDVNAKIIDIQLKKIIYNGISHPGSSGSPILNDEFELLGVHTGTTPDIQNKYFIPIHTILESLSSSEYDLIMR